MTFSSAQFAFEGTITFLSVAAGTVVDQTVTVPRLMKDAFVCIIIPNLQDGLTFCNARCGSNGHLTIRFSNQTDGDLTPLGTTSKLIQY